MDSAWRLCYLLLFACQKYHNMSTRCVRFQTVNITLSALCEKWNVFYPLLWEAASSESLVKSRRLPERPFLADLDEISRS